MYALIVFLSGPEAENYLALSDDRAVELLSRWDNGDETVSDSESYYGLESTIVPHCGEYISEHGEYVLIKNYGLQYVVLYRKVES